MRVTGPADRLLVAGLTDLQPLFDGLRGNVMLVGGLMARMWLHLRPVEDLLPRATADIDLGIDRHGLGLGPESERVRPLLEQRGYRPAEGEESFRFRRRFEDGQSVLVDLFVAKGASRTEPPTLEKGITTLAAPGLAYAISRGPIVVSALFVDGDATTELRLALPTLDAAFVLKGALAASGVRTRPDRVQRDRVDAVMLAAACMNDAVAVAALASAHGKEPRSALQWISKALARDDTPTARALRRHLEEQYAIPGGASWAVSVRDRLLRATAAS